MVDTPQSIVIIGANGAGKTRLGTWIEFNSPQRALVHRIAAQKSLTLPRRVSTSDLEAAKADLIFGWTHPTTGQLGTFDNKLGNKWGQSPNTHLQNDYDKLLVYLFSDEFEKSTRYRQESLGRPEKIATPGTQLDIVKRIWHKVMPHRELITGGGKIEVKTKGSTAAPYSASDMSDGERVAFYLIGQCMAAPTNGIIVIDEPELHLHKAIQSSLWSEVEQERSDCLFVYITHDLDFAASRSNAKKLWLKSFDGSNWDWEEVPENTGIAEDILLTVLGSRKPVLFIEGEKGSLDHFVFTNAYPDYTIVPCGSCHGVMASSAAFKARAELHHLNCRGVIDRDYRDDEAVEYLRERGLCVLDVAEIENCLITEGVIRAVCEKLLLDAESVFEAAKERVFAELTKEVGKLASALTAFKIEANLKSFDSKQQGAEGLQASLNSLAAAIDVDSLYADELKRVSDIVAARNYEEAIKLYSNKGLMHMVGGTFGKMGNEWLPYVRRLIEQEPHGNVLKSIRATLAVT